MADRSMDYGRKEAPKMARPTLVSIVLGELLMTSEAETKRQLAIRIVNAIERDYVVTSRKNDKRL